MPKYRAASRRHSGSALAGRQQPQRRQDRQRRIGGQHIVAAAWSAPPRPSATSPPPRPAESGSPARRARHRQPDAGQHEQNRRPEGDRREQQIIAGRRAMAFLAARQLGGEIIAQRLLKEGAMAFQRDRDQPGRRSATRQQHSPRSGFRCASQRHLPTHGLAGCQPVANRAARHGGRRDARRRPDPSPECPAANAAQPASTSRRRKAARLPSRGAVDPQQDTLHAQDRGQQHRVGGGDGGFGGQQQRGAQQQRRDQARLGAERRGRTRRSARPPAMPPSSDGRR